MNIRKARKEDLPQVMEIIRMAQQSFREQGINQWQDGYPNEAIILQDMEKKQSYVAQEKELMVGTAVISMEKEQFYEKIEKGTWLTERDADYLVIHRIATRNGCKRKGIAGAFLEEAGRKALEQQAGSIRIDTHPDNQIMQSWLKRHGFVYCGWIWLASGDLRYAYEKLL